MFWSPNALGFWLLQTWCGKRIGCVTGPLLNVAVAHLVPWSFAAVCLQNELDWLRQSCNFSRFCRCPFSSIFLYFPLFSSIFLYFPLFSSIFLYFPLFSSIFLYFPLFSSIFLYFPHNSVLKKPFAWPFFVAALRSGFGAGLRQVPWSELARAAKSWEELWGELRKSKISWDEIWLVVWLPLFIFPYIGNNHPNWLILFRGVETTNQI